MTIPIRSDEPADVDTLDRKRFAEALARVIATCESPLVIGIFGTWGLGKTSLMKQIRELVGKTQDIRTIWFDPWQHQFDEDPAVALLHTMVDQLNLGGEGKKLLTVIAGALGSILLKSTTTLNAKDIQEVAALYEEERFQVREKQVRLKSYFQALMREATDNGRLRLVFFIDDLDRCVPEQVLKVLEALKLYLALPGCVYVMGVDRSALECSIRHRYKDQEIREADYLDKIVQLPFTIPPIARSSMAKFIKPLLPESLVGLLDLLVAGLGDNPRQGKRFVNTLLLNHELASAMFGAQYQPTILAAILIVQYRRPELFKAAIVTPAILQTLALGGDSAKPYEEYIKGDRRLAEVLSMAAFQDSDSIAQYIYLTEVASVRKLSFDVVLTSIGANKIGMIKAVREHTTLGLKEAKDLVESKLPAVLAADLPREKANAFAAALKSSGGTAKIR